MINDDEQIKNTKRITLQTLLAVQRRVVCVVFFIQKTSLGKVDGTDHGVLIESECPTLGEVQTGCETLGRLVGDKRHIGRVGDFLLFKAYHLDIKTSCHETTQLHVVST